MSPLGFELAPAPLEVVSRHN